uniref:Protein disulfide isomerase family A, member 5 n=1 Tax=Eptatretus burgeri TaxID=7764 RepID=A0A8C4Q781_EPTBU
MFTRTVAIGGVFLLVACVCPRTSGKGKRLQIERLGDLKDLKKLVRTRNNVLVWYKGRGSGNDKKLQLLEEVAEDVRGMGTVVWVDCGNQEARKICKKMKVEPGASGTLYHYKDGEFHLEYTRPETFKSLTAFMKDPTGDALWEEEPGANDLVHIHSEKDLHSLLKKAEKPILLMFYAPWCGVCKQVKPAFQEAATLVKKSHVLAAMNVHTPEFEGVKAEFGVSGYPTFCYFEKGHFLFNYEAYNAQANDIVKWLQSPEPPKPKVQEVPWNEQDSAVHHLTDVSFQAFVDEHPSTMIMFYAPWCGHCKKMKPEFEEAAAILNTQDGSPGVLAAVDAAAHRDLATQFSVSGFPTIKYFQNGKDTYTLPELRSKDRIIEWMHDPQPPPPPEAPWDELVSSVVHLTADVFRDVLKKKKHGLVMFYAPWCFHCKEAKPHFSAAAGQLEGDRKMVMAAVDCTKQQNQELCTQEGIKGYPTIHLYSYGKMVQHYSGPREESDFVEFMRSLPGRDLSNSQRSHTEL